MLSRLAKSIVGRKCKENRWRAPRDGGSWLVFGFASRMSRGGGRTLYVFSGPRFRQSLPFSPSREQCALAPEPPLFHSVPSIVHLWPPLLDPTTPSLHEPQPLIPHARARPGAAAAHESLVSNPASAQAQRSQRPPPTPPSSLVSSCGLDFELRLLDG